MVRVNEAVSLTGRRNEADRQEQIGRTGIMRNGRDSCVCLLMVLWASVFGCFPVCFAAEGQRHPNVVFILADDLGHRDLANEGSVFYESPAIDRVSRMGMKFTRGYATCQVCSPSRASILTGKYPARLGITTWIGDRSGQEWRKTGRFDSHLPPDYKHQLDAAEITLAEAFRSAGYRTFFAGKWHLGDRGSWPEDHGFEVNRGGWRVGGPGRGGFFSPYANPNLDDGPAGESLPLRLGQETARFIERHRDVPFLAYLSFYSVHAPIQTTEALWRKYREKAVAAGLVDRRFIFDRRLAVRQVQDCPIYAGMIEAMDSAVGLVLDKLEELDLLDNTIICFTSDNGGVSSGDAFSTSNLPLRGGKGRQWEGGIREPFYLAAPGVTRAGSQCKVPVSGIDWYPTLLELAGIKLPDEQRIDGVSLVPLLEGRQIGQRPLFWHYPHYGNQGGEPSSIIMEGDWKLIYYHEDGREELYHLGRDVGEQQNLVESEPALARQMRNRLNTWLKGVDARFPAPDSKFNAERRSQRWRELRTTGMRGLEARHGGYLDPDYQPGPSWWGSLLPD